MRTDAVAGAALLLACLAAPARAQHGEEVPQDMHDWDVTAFVLSEVLEYAPIPHDDRAIHYDLHGWIGGAYNRLWLKADGEQSVESSAGATLSQLVYGRLISPYWDAQVGLAVEALYGGGRTEIRPMLAAGLQGLAPGWFEVEPTVFVSTEGDVSANLTASYDLFLTQRLVGQPRVELGAAVQEAPEFGVGSGLTALELGFRLRYELWREIAPYIGISWERSFGETATLARAGGGSASELFLVAGLRLWY